MVFCIDIFQSHYNHFVSLVYTVCLFAVFCGRIKNVIAIHAHLKKSGYAAGCLHGKMDQLDREETILKFRDDSFRILVATSIAARGIDIAAVAKVINYDMSPTIQDYEHRIGRTGRIGSTGDAVSYFNNYSRRMAGVLIEFLRTHNQTVPEWLLEIAKNAVSKAEEKKRKKKHMKKKSTKKVDAKAAEQV